MRPAKAASSAVLCAAALWAAASAPCSAAASLIYEGGSPVTMSVTDLSNSAIVGAAVTYLVVFSGSNGGNVSIVPPATLPGSGSIPLNSRDFSVRCVEVSGTSGSFVSSGLVQLNGSTKCATLVRGYSNAVVEFQIVLQLDGSSSAPASFPADTYNGVFTVTATDS